MNRVVSRNFWFLFDGGALMPDEFLIISLRSQLQGKQTIGTIGMKAMNPKRLGPRVRQTRQDVGGRGS